MSRAHRVTFGPGAFLAGAFITVLIFGVPLGPTGYIFGTASALLLGMPLALVTGLAIRPVRSQLWHVAAIGAAGLMTGAVTVVYLMGTGSLANTWGLVVWTGICAAIGRFAVCRLVKCPTPDGRIVP